MHQPPQPRPGPNGFPHGQFAGPAGPHPVAGPSGAPQPWANPPGITVDASYHWTSVGTGWFIKPRVFVNGHPVPGARWGRTHIPVGAGSYHVEVAVSSGSRSVVGIQVPVGPGAGTTVYYSASALGFAKGAIGAEPQRSPRAIPAIVLTIAALAYAVWSIGGLALNIAF